MAIRVACVCGQHFETQEANAGRRARCLDCGREIIIPRPERSAGGEAKEPGRATTRDLAGEGWPEKNGTGTVPVVTATSGKAIASVVLGALSFACMLLTAVPAVILGVLGLREIKQGEGRITGTGLAVTGIVLGCLGLVFSVAAFVPAVTAIRDASHRSQCTNNLKRIGLAMHNYHDQRGAFPAGAIRDQTGRPLLSWRVAILPYLGDAEASLYQQFHLDEPWDSPHNLTLLRLMPPVYACPEARAGRAGQTVYQVVVGPNTMFTGARPVSIRDVTDGTTYTVLVGEAVVGVPWSAPNDLDTASGLPLYGLSSGHAGGFNVLFADGSVRFIRNSINPTTLHNLLTRSGGEVISGF